MGEGTLPNKLECLVGRIAPLHFLTFSWSESLETLTAYVTWMGGGLCIQSGSGTS